MSVRVLFKAKEFSRYIKALSGVNQYGKFVFTHSSVTCQVGDPAMIYMGYISLDPTTFLEYDLKLNDSCPSVTSNIHFLYFNMAMKSIEDSDTCSLLINSSNSFVEFNIHRENGAIDEHLIKVIEDNDILEYLDGGSITSSALINIDKFMLALRSLNTLTSQCKMSIDHNYVNIETDSSEQNISGKTRIKALTSLTCSGVEKHNFNSSILLKVTSSSSHLGEKLSIIYRGDVWPIELEIKLQGDGFMKYCICSIVTEEDMDINSAMESIETL